MQIEPEQNGDNTPAGGDDDMSAAVADVFGLDFGNDENNSTEDNNDSSGAQEPSVGTEGDEGEDGVTPDSSSSTPPAEDGGAGSAATVQPKEEKKPQEGQQEQQPPQEPTSDPRALEMASLKAQLQSALSEIEKLKKPEGDTKPGQQPSAAGQQEDGQPAQPKPLNVQLPNDLVNAILGDDPQQAHNALNTMVSSLATGLNARFEQRVAALEASMNDKFQQGQTQQQQSQQADQAKQHREDYFKAFPQHNKPLFMPILAQEAQQLAAEHPGVAWDENFRNTLGTRVNQKLKEAGFNVGVTPPAQKPATPKPAAMMPNGNRPAADEDDNIVAETLGVF